LSSPYHLIILKNLKISGRKIGRLFKF